MSIEQTLTVWKRYSEARQELLAAAEVPESNRDPLAELSEYLVARLIQATPAESRVNKGWDLLREDGRTVEVKYVANRTGAWINGHDVRFPPGRKEHALVIVVDLHPVVVLIFDEPSASTCYSELDRTHARGDDQMLALGPPMLKKIVAGNLDLTAYGVEVISLDQEL